MYVYDWLSNQSHTFAVQRPKLAVIGINQETCSGEPLRAVEVYEG